jgi:hypothetical protein
MQFSSSGGVEFPQHGHFRSSSNSAIAATPSTVDTFRAFDAAG